jgi:hypothetical protein
MKILKSGERLLRSLRAPENLSMEIDDGEIRIGIKDARDHNGTCINLKLKEALDIANCIHELITLIKNPEERAS